MNLIAFGFAMLALLVGLVWLTCWLLEKTPEWQEFPILATAFTVGSILLILALSSFGDGIQELAKPPQ